MSLSPTQIQVDVTGRLRLAASSSLRRWRSPGQALRHQGHRRWDALMILLVIASVLIVAIEADAWAARAVADLRSGLRGRVRRCSHRL